jgi:hypothetical protein
MKGKTNSPEDKDRTVHRVVAWLSKDIGSYDALEDDLVSTCTCKGCVAAPMFADKVLSPTASALYDALVLAAKGANEQASNSTKTKGTYEFQLVNLCEDHASAHKKHIYLGTASEDIELRFSPCTQKLNITSPTITSCFELDISALPLTLVGTRAHVPNMPTVNCMIYSTKPIKKYTLDYTLPEIKGAPRQNNKELKAFLKENCAKYLDFAPYAVKYKTSLGNVGPKVLKCEVKILGPEVESEEENDE